MRMENDYSHCQIDDSNWRIELKKPVDKYDWIAFDKIFQSVFIYPESERNRVCKFANLNDFVLFSLSI